MMKLDNFIQTKHYKKTGIYKIYNENGFYIGSSKDLKKRIQNHIGLLKFNKHTNYILQEQVKLGLFIEVIEILDIYSKETLLILENYYINTLNPPWNISKVAGAPMEGRKHSDKTRKKMKGREVWNKGIPRTEEDKEKMRIAKYNRAIALNPNYIPKKFLKKDKSFICIETGKIFKRQIDAIKEYKIHPSALSSILKGKNLKGKNLSFKYIDGSTPIFKDTHFVNIIATDGSIFRKSIDLATKLNISYSTIRYWLKKQGFFEYNGVKYVKST